MFNKINSTTLLIILVVLVALAALNKFYFSKRSDSTFNDTFVQIDSAKVTQFLVYPLANGHKEIKITKQPKGWSLQIAQTKTTASEPIVHNLLEVFSNLKSIALAANDKTGWKQYQVDDSTGSRIKILTSDNKTYDMIVGKFGFNPAARNGVSYIRRSGEDAVYAVNGFLSFAVNKSFNDWRDRTIVSGNKDNWTKLSFSYPGDSSFVLSKQNNTWTVNNAPADSVKVTQYLNNLTSVQSNNFADAYTPASAPLYTLTIEGSSQSAPVSVTVYPADSTQKFMIHSSLNPDAWFSDGNTRTVERIFVSPRSF
jgi:hypothetical protein